VKSKNSTAIVEHISMPISIYNTLSGTKEEFKPLIKGKATIYVCGPTVYDIPHIGHVRSAFVFEVIRRILSEYCDVTFVRNVTDIDDKIIERALLERISPNEVAKKYLSDYRSVLSRAGLTRPTHEPKATDQSSLKAMHQLIKTLCEKGLAYDVSGNVYFKVHAFSSYGKLSGQRMDALLENVRKESGEGKRDPLDFALWKKSKADEPAWDSPWGKGRPGWHIECSAMSMYHLGESFDIHGGGKDLLFPHHENERAQALGAGKGFAKVWIHHGLLTVDSRKMSKSLKNYVTLDEVLKRYPLDALILFFLQSHYSQDADFTWEKMNGFHEAVKSFYRLFKETQGIASKAGASLLKNEEGILLASLEDDFNTPKAIACLFKVLSKANEFLKQGKIKEASGCAEWIVEHGRWMGLFADGIKNDRAKKTVSDSRLKDIIRIRDQARRDKKFKVSDLIRSRLEEMGFDVNDKETESKVTLINDCGDPELRNKLRNKLERLHKEIDK
jgi:cysteinyl-tRNA synthetase